MTSLPSKHKEIRDLLTGSLRGLGGRAEIVRFFKNMQQGLIG